MVIGIVADILVRLLLLLTYKTIQGKQFYHETENQNYRIIQGLGLRVWDLEDLVKNRFIDSWVYHLACRGSTNTYYQVAVVFQVVGRFHKYGWYRKSCMTPSTLYLGNLNILRSCKAFWLLVLSLLCIFTSSINIVTIVGTMTNTITIYSGHARLLVSTIGGPRCRSQYIRMICRGTAKGWGLGDRIATPYDLKN